MADFTKTISNSMNVFGVEPSTKWNDFLWGTGKWGFGSTPTIWSFEKNLAQETITTTDLFAKEPEKVLENAITPLSETTDMRLQDGNGYYYVFVKPSVDADERGTSTFTVDTRPTTSWTEDTDPSTSWTED